MAPLYDIASFLPYAGSERGVKLAMKIGGKYEMDEIRPQHWQQLAADSGVDAGRALGRVRDIIARLPGEALSVLASCRKGGLRSRHLDTLADLLWQRVRGLATIFGAEAMPS